MKSSVHNAAAIYEWNLQFITHLYSEISEFIVHALQIPKLVTCILNTQKKLKWTNNLNFVEVPS